MTHRPRVWISSADTGAMDGNLVALVRFALVILERCGGGVS
jgi:hypothetical protein